MSMISPLQTSLSGSKPRSWLKQFNTNSSAVKQKSPLHLPVYVLEDRSAGIFATWLRQHPGVEIISRDRSKDYQRGATKNEPLANEPVMFLWVLPFFHDVLHVGWLEPHLSAHSSLAAKLYADGYDAFIIGLIAGFAIKRITRPVLNANRLFFCRRWIAKGRRPHWWMPPCMRYTIEALDRREDSVEHNKEQFALKGHWFGPFVMSMAIVILLLAVYEYDIIVYIA